MYISYIKGALIITARNLEEQLADQRTKRQVLVLVNNKLTFREQNQRFKLKDKDKL